MRVAAGVLLIVMASGPLSAQSYPPGQPPPPSPRRPPRMVPFRSQYAANAEGALKSAIEQFGADKKTYDRDLDVLRHLRAADEALTDPMQPMNAIQKAWDEVQQAKVLQPDFLVYQGVIKVIGLVEDARRSPQAADFGRLRAQMRSEAIGPAERVVARNGARLQEETLAWIRVQELISTHLRMLAEATGESLRASQ